MIVMNRIEAIQIYLNHQENSRKPYVTFEHKVLTYGDLALRVKQISALFAAKQVLNQSRLVICSDDDEVIITFTVAAFLHGITSIVISPETKASRAISLINYIKPDLIVVDVQLADQWQLGNIFNVFKIRKVLSIGSKSLLAKFKRNSKPSSWLDDITGFTEQLSPVQIVDSQLAFIIFTSGSTAEPKGVQISYKNLFVHLETFGKKFDYNQNSRILNNMLLAHVDGLLQGPILTLYFGSQLYRSCSMEIQQLEYYLNTVYRERISHVITVPTILSLIDRLTNHNDYFEASDFKYLISVAGILNPDLWKRLEQRFQLKLSNIYGLTETVMGGIFCGPDPESYRHGSVGKPTDMEITIVDQEGNPVVNGAEGELLLRGENVFVGYDGDEISTANAFKGNWFCTGDLAYQDQDDFVYISGRKKEIIISGGFNIHPAEVNEAVLKHQAVAEVATIGYPDRDWGEIIVSTVVCKLDCNLSEVDLINHCRNLLEDRKIPKRIVFLDSLPRGDAGKVQIPQLQQLLHQKTASSGSNLTLESFFTIAAEVFQIDSKKLSLRDRAGQISGWDSLGHLRLVLSVEQATGVNLSVNQIMKIESLNDLWEMIDRESKV